jgi:hypothetical protein
MSAVANLQYEQNQIEILSKLYLYGSEATDEIGSRIIEEINRMYNEPQAVIQINSKPMKVVFKVTYKLVTTAEAMLRAAINLNFRNNYIRIENENHITRSFMGFGLGDNVGHWLTTDNLGLSTTAAHEFGHSLGLDHPARLDFRGLDTPPPIMAPRGSLVNTEYQWNPLARAGEYGGTMNPKYRKVTQEEVRLILQDLSFENDTNAYLGQISNTLFDKTGSPTRWLS